ncbi:4-aminobutyrate---pyruvate transaminase [Roseovarius pacificus]|uniref:4-aminobutyrate---pyruvate transaminase n=1 Tax=Roseovarius pacificus TaxID=337701 RepID=A0A1M7AC31_9RHOB|nr:aspartate aminotransferase family protein [Roseovarius pacificus]GGO53634.1 aspartate aminotransferase family protein [Roseovarius pacificus]SHL40232.1 4-aminobutyrate---pyruvate transaminase [Roseovarius pacificus]
MDNQLNDAPNSRHAVDVKRMLHPYTDARAHEKAGPLIITDGSGVEVFDNQGKSYIEAMAGLWSVAVGFGEKRLVDAATRQMSSLPYYHTFSHKSNEPAIDLADRLVAMTGRKMEKVFFTNSGSEANDTVVKLLWYRNNALGQPERKKIISRKRGYHGITIAAGSMTGIPMNHGGFDLPLPGFHHLTCPHFYREGFEGETEAEFTERLAQELEELIEREGSETIAGFIGEPLMSAGGVVPPPAGYWRRVQEICRKHEIVVIADEVITGFGRLGTRFGSDYYDIEPDIMVMSKQLTSSYQPLAAIVMTDDIYQPVADQSSSIGAFGHGFTASGHPVATAVALENLDIIEERDLIGNAARLAPMLQAKLREFSDHALVGEVRGEGFIAAVELVANKTSRSPFDPVGVVGRELAAHAHAAGLIIRAIGDTIAFCPPLIATEEDVTKIITRFGLALDATTRTLP